MLNFITFAVLFFGISLNAQNDSIAKREAAYKRNLLRKIDSVLKLGPIITKKDTMSVKDLNVKKDSIIQQTLIKKDSINEKELNVKKDSAIQKIAVVSKNLINQLDSLGKRDGKWIVYLDNNWKHIEDSLSASHYRYTYYSHGTNIYPMGPCGKEGYKLESSNIGRSKLLHGEYKWFDAKGRTTSIHILNHGEYISCKEYFHSGKVSQFFDYKKKCEGEIHGWHAYIYDDEGELLSEKIMCKDKNGHWPHTKD